MGKSILKIFVFVAFVSVVALFGYKIYGQPLAVVVPHHNIVADKRLEMLKIVRKRRILTQKVIVLSPDHFSNDQKTIAYSDRNWGFPKSGIDFYDKFDNKFFNNMQLNNELVRNDHGVFNVLSDVSLVWPKVKVVPIIIGQQVKFQDLVELISNISKYCRLNCLLIASVDFSHYLPFKIADVHDEESLEALINFDLKEGKQIEVDSPQSLYSLITFAKNKSSNNFNYYAHTNSAKLSNMEDVESTSHIFGWYERKLFKRRKIYDVKTFTYAKNINKKDNLSSLGERFFYGVDDLNLNKPEIDSSFVVVGYETKEEIKKIFIPIKCSGNICEFARGEEKKKLLHELPDGVDNISGEIVISKN